MKKHLSYFLFLLIVFFGVIAGVLHYFGLLNDIIEKYNPLKKEKDKNEFKIEDEKDFEKFLNYEAKKLLEERKQLKKQKQIFKKEKEKMKDIIEKNYKTKEGEKSQVKKKEDKIDKLQKEIELKEAKIQTLKKQNKEKMEDNLSRLVKIYSRMNSQKAASILVRMDNDFLVKIFSRMRPRNVSKILVNFPKGRTSKLNKMLENM